VSYVQTSGRLDVGTHPVLTGSASYCQHSRVGNRYIDVELVVVVVVVVDESTTKPRLPLLRHKSCRQQVSMMTRHTG